MIRLSGETSVDGARDAVWQVLADPERLAPCLPNVSGLRVEGADRFSATIAPETSTGLTAFDMTFALGDRVPSERLTVTGQAAVAERAALLTAELELSGDGAETVVRWRVDARFLGPFGAVGQRVLPDIVRNEIQRALRAAGEAAAPVV